MKRKIAFTVCLFLLSLTSFAGKFVLIPVHETTDLVTLFDDRELKIHYYCNDYVLATTEKINYNNAVILDNHAFADAGYYAIVDCADDYKSEYLAKTADAGKLLYSGNDFLIMKIVSKNFIPAKNDGMMAIMDIEARLPKATAAFPVVTEPDEDVVDYISQVSADRMMANIQTLQDFETRFFQHPNSILAQNWLKEQYEMLGLDVEIQELTESYESVSHNVIAIQYGTEFPDEYIVCGAHYDSFSYQLPDIAPGADDNASGSAGILEIAGILSQYEFKRSIVYCAFAAEEWGLFGSGYYANHCANERMNIVAYFNMDMIGFLAPEEEIKIHFSDPSSAEILAGYCENICNVYFPEIPFSCNNYMSSSDHRSFINAGYLGITSIEHDFLGNPYYHQIDDLIGFGVNSPELVETLTRANVASIATLAMYDVAMPLPPLAPPTNCVAEHLQGRVIQVSWEAPVENSPDKYCVYKDGKKIAEVAASQLTYKNTLPNNDFDEHCYAVIAGYGFLWESDFSNESCASVPVSINELHSKINIYPNPVNYELKITNYGGEDTNNGACPIVEIYDVMGRCVATVETRLIASLQSASSETTIDVSHLPAGVYFVRISNEFVGKFIKE